MLSNWSPQPLSPDFLRWQIRLRAHTMAERGGAPHVGVAPLLTVRRPGFPLSVTTHSIICGVLPHPDTLAAKTEDFRALYQNYVAAGSRELYDRGIKYLKGYYRDEADFDSGSLTTLTSNDSPLFRALSADPRCQLVFYVFNLDDRSEIGRSRCLQLDCQAEVHRKGPVYDNVWWHNAIFHGEVEDAAVIRFRHLRTYDTQFGHLQEVT
ncbi:MAG TPA: hypothetical protein VGS22_19980 [Thermoanaerobaculia bacterium]|nr:hypothetical protein [Thermoanaerobaculia bacterium]